MKFSAREDIEVPIEAVFDRISDVDVFERQALRYGAEVERRKSRDGAPGPAWRIKFKFRGRERKVMTERVVLEPPTLQVFDFTAAGLAGQTRIELVPLSPKRTRLAVGIEVTANTLTARLLLQSLRLAKSNLNARFKTRVHEQAQSIETKYREGV